MKMRKYWKIGTDVTFYLKDFIDIKNYFGENGFKIFQAEKQNYFVLGNMNGIINNNFNYQKTKIFQMLISFYSMGLIYFDNNLSFNSTKNINEVIKRLVNEGRIIKFNNSVFQKEVYEVIGSYYASKEFNNTISRTIEYYSLDENDDENGETINIFENETTFNFSLAMFFLNYYDNWDGKTFLSLFGEKEYENFLEMKSKPFYKNLAREIIDNNNDITLKNIKSNFALLVSDEYYHEDLKDLQKEVNEIPDNENNSNNENIIWTMQHEKNKPGMETELFNLAKFLDFFKNEKSKLKVPINQRTYKWNEEIINKLLDDILEVKDNETHHYLGTVITTRISNKSTFNPNTIYKVVDGQQRLTSLLIILKAFYDTLVEKKYRTNDYFLENIFLVNDKNKENAITKIFIHVENTDDFNNFRNLMLNNKADVVKWSQISKNYNSVKKELSSFSFEKLQKFYDNLLLKIYFIFLIDEDTKNEYALFENMNTKSLKLETIELIKNIIFMHVEEDVIDREEKELNRNFNLKILDKFKDNNGNLNEKDIDNFISSFLQFYKTLLNYENDKTLINQIVKTKNNSDSLYETFKNVILKLINDYKNKLSGKLDLEGFNKLIDELSKWVDLYKNITSPQQYMQTSDRLYLIGDILFMFEKRQIYIPILMKLINDHLNEDKTKLIDLNGLRNKLLVFESFEMKFQLISYRGQSLTQTMNEILNRISKKDYEITTQNLLNELPKEMPTNEKMYEFIKNENISSAKVATKLLFRVEFYLKNNCSMIINDLDFRYNYISPKLSREHIMPVEIEKNWISDWQKENTNWTKEYLKGEHDKTLNLLGNSAALLSTLNSTASNKKFSIKKREYENNANAKDTFWYQGFRSKKNNLELMSIENKEHWDFEDIKNRSEQLGNILKEIYLDK